MTAGITVTLRPAAVDDADAVASIWCRGWRDGHLGNVPAALTDARTERSFWTRAADRVAGTTVAEVDGRVAGFIMVVGDELEQVYVDSAYRGTAVAGTLLAEAERQVHAEGHACAWLAVVAGNAPARRFYAKHGWIDEGPFDYQVGSATGVLPIPAHRYVKDVGPMDGEP